MSGFVNGWLRATDPLHLMPWTPEKKSDNKPKMLPVSGNTMLSPKAGEDTTLKPGQRTNLISTSPQGVLEPATSNRATLLGG